MGIVRGVVTKVGGAWPIDGSVMLPNGAYVEATAEARRIVGESLVKASPATAAEAVDELLLSPCWPGIGWYDVRRIAAALGPTAPDQLRADPLLVRGLVARPRRLGEVWAGIGTG